MVHEPATTHHVGGELRFDAKPFNLFVPGARIGGRDLSPGGKAVPISPVCGPGCVRAPANPDVRVNLSRFPKVRFFKALI